MNRDAKLADVAAKQVALAVATRSAIAAKKDPETDANVIAARTALTDAENALKTAEDNYKQSDHGILHAWETAVPETTWLLLADYEESTRALNDLKASDPAILKTDLDQAEADFVERSSSRRQFKRDGTARRRANPARRTQAERASKPAPTPARRVARRQLN